RRQRRRVRRAGGGLGASRVGGGPCGGRRGVFRARGKRAGRRARDGQRLGQWLGERVGPHTRRIAYFHLLADRRWFFEVADRNVGRVQAVAYALCSPLIRRGLRRALGVDRSRTDASVASLRKRIAELDERLGERPYLVGGRFTAADLSVACLLAPVLAVTPAEGYSAVIVARHGLPDELATLVEEVRSSRIGRHALRMLAQERRTIAASRPS
ncbi:MAG: glutathione S-transferase C-terminal domain-containing protein, partial [Myxococcota bacterium]